MIFYDKTSTIQENGLSNLEKYITVPLERAARLGSDRVAVCQRNPKDTLIGRSIIGSEFTCRIEEELELPGGVKAIRPSIAGQGGQRR